MSAVIVKHPVEIRREAEDALRLNIAKAVKDAISLGVSPRDAEDVLMDFIKRERKPA